MINGTSIYILLEFRFIFIIKMNVVLNQTGLVICRLRI